MNIVKNHLSGVALLLVFWIELSLVTHGLGSSHQVDHKPMTLPANVLEEITKYLSSKSVKIKDDSLIESLLDSIHDTNEYNIKIADKKRSLKELKIIFSGEKRNVEDLKQKALALGEEFEQLFEGLKKSLLTKIRVTSDQSSYSSLEDAELDQNLVRRELNLFINDLEREERKVLVQELTHQCINEIKRGSNDEGDGKLKLVNGANNVNMFVTGDLDGGEVLPNAAEMSLKFSEQIDQVNEEFLFCKQINHELRVYQPKDSRSIHALIKLFQRIVRTTKDCDVRKEAIRVLERYESQYKLVLKDSMKDHLFTFNWKDSRFNFTLADNMYHELNAGWFSEVYKDFVEEMHRCRSIDFATLMKHSRDRYFIAISLLSYHAIYNTMKTTNQTNNPALIILAFLIHETENSNGYKHIWVGNKDKLNQMKNELPKSLINLFYLKQICIKNVLTNKYLSTRGDTNNGVQLSNAGDGSTSTQWKLEWHPAIDNRFYIHNVRNDKYLAIDDVGDNYDPNNRYLTTVSGNDKQYRGLWYIEVDNNSILIKSYLFDDDYLAVTRGSDSIITSSGLADLGTKLWLLETC